MTHAINLGVSLALLWMLLSGHTDLLLVALGIISVILAATLAARMEVIERESFQIHLSWKLPIYWLWLLWEIMRANIAVARAILSPRSAVTPRVVNVTAGQKTDMGRVTYANSITLTPGTVTISLDGDRLGVHALTEESASDLETGEMDRRVSGLRLGRGEEAAPQ